MPAILSRFSITGVVRNFDVGEGKWKNFVTLFWWRFLMI